MFFLSLLSLSLCLSPVCTQLGAVSLNAAVRAWAMLAYDDVLSIEYFGVAMPPYWRRFGEDGTALLANASRDYSSCVA
jgi:hypothetical protein